ncbi:MAG: S8 family serine peptidase [Luteolibacter sp.]|uniref:S8 family serine peptidase n=1 Tax=Luteolibacter sp. TaxID=1962973 RepID=UPI003264EFD7
MSAKPDEKPPEIINDSALQKLQPKLRVIMNGDSKVNAVRSERSGCIAVLPSEFTASLPDIPSVTQAQSIRFSAVPAAQQKQAPLAGPVKDIQASVFVHTRASGDKSRKLPGETARRQELATLELPLSELKVLASSDDVVFIEAGQQLSAPKPLKSRDRVATPPDGIRQVGKADLHKDGKGVLVGIIDVEGFDFSHPDFLDKNGGTRFVNIWDQGGDARPAPKQKSCHYGAEFKKIHLDAALKAAAGLGVSPTDVEPQSQRVTGSHGTHVASIAAGNAGVAREASIAAVLITVSKEDLTDRRKSFYDSTRIAHAVEYLLALGEEMNMPVAINISLGTNGHAHDGSSPVSRWIDSALTTPGRAVCIAAGNAGQENSLSAGDFGFVTGRIHTSGRLASAGLSHDIEWTVVGDKISDVSENELELWYAPQDRFSVSIRPPGGKWIGPVGPGEFIENHRLPDGTVLSIYNELYHAANGSNYLSLYLSPFYPPPGQGIVGIAAGVWAVRIHADEVRDGRYHGWIERDDPRRTDAIPGPENWRFPSFFSERSNIDDSSISSMATGHQVIAVGNLDEPVERIHITSSQGPTRDGREKPDVAAAGTEITAANGFSASGSPWIRMTGTSMASPYVCGVTALMLGVQPKLTAAQILGIMRRTARPLPGMDYQWRNDSGFGVIHPEACITEASLIFTRTDLKP